MYIFIYLVKWTEPDNKKVFFKSCDVNMLIISSFTFIMTISEFLKNKRTINIKTEKAPSLLNFKTEFISSWSVIKSLKSCIADCSYLLFYLILISLFLSDRPLHLSLFLSLSLFLLYVLLPFSLLLQIDSLFLLSFVGSAINLQKTESLFNLCTYTINRKCYFSSSSSFLKLS